MQRPAGPDEFACAARLIEQAHAVVALTGAGISTASGIPDFRSVYSGLWGENDPMEVASLTSFRQHPEVFFNWVRPLLQKIHDAQPNPAHDALARMSELGRLDAVITQNIDALHNAAGSQTVYAMHGHVKTATCTYCFKHFEAKPIIASFLQTGDIPRCDCSQQAVLKPDVILFEEQLPVNTVQQARQATLRADVFIVAGTSLRVAPAGDLPRLAHEYGARLIIANDEPTYADRYAEVVLRGDVAQMLPEIVRLLDKE